MGSIRDTRRVVSRGDAQKQIGACRLTQELEAGVSDHC
jgi:hypothetical protein